MPFLSSFKKVGIKDALQTVGLRRPAGGSRLQSITTDVRPSVKSGVPIHLTPPHPVSKAGPSHVSGPNQSVSAALRAAQTDWKAKEAGMRDAIVELKQEIHPPRPSQSMYSTHSTTKLMPKVRQPHLPTQTVGEVRRIALRERARLTGTTDGTTAHSMGNRRRLVTDKPSTRTQPASIKPLYHGGNHKSAHTSLSTERV